MSTLDVYVCFGHERGTNYPHWMLMLSAPGSSRGTWYHSTGGPTQNKPYKLEIEANKRTNSHGIEHAEKVGTIAASDQNKVKAAAQSVEPQQCQYFVVSVLAKMENKNLIPSRTASAYRDRIQISSTAQSYRDDHPVPSPNTSQYHTPEEGSPRRSSNHSSPSRHTTPPRDSSSRHSSPHSTSGRHHSPAHSSNLAPRSTSSSRHTSGRP